MNKNIGDMTESELKDFIIELNEKLSRKERTIDKAIEYLEEHYSDFPEGMKEDYDVETIKILRGEINENI